jgi:antitoxin component YwqK of YwqJK toxin-antitoxin module
LNKNGLKEGEWVAFYANGKESSKGQFAFGRQTGLWHYSYENGNPMSSGSFVLDLNDGEWEYFYEDGKPMSKGSFVLSEQVGVWTQWYANGNKKEEIEYLPEGISKILNTWNEDGKEIIANGKGTLEILDEAGNVIETGSVNNGLRDGKWDQFYAGGKKRETGEYKEGTYYLKDLWDASGTTIISDGSGLFDYTSDGMKLSGKIDQGLRVDVWKTTYAESDQVASELTYKNGKLDGISKNYDMDGAVTVEGLFVDNKRDGLWKWYSNGVVESEVTFVKGKKEGDQKFYNSYGDWLKTEVYKDGKLVSTNVEGE